MSAAAARTEPAGEADREARSGGTGAENRDKAEAAGATRGKPRMAAQLRPEKAPASKPRRTSAGDRAVPTESGAGRASQVVKPTSAELVRVEAEAATARAGGVEGARTRLAGSDRERPMAEATSASASSPGPDAAGSSGRAAPAEDGLRCAGVSVEHCCGFCIPAGRGHPGGCGHGGQCRGIGRGEGCDAGSGVARGSSARGTSRRGPRTGARDRASRNGERKPGRRGPRPQGGGCGLREPTSGLAARQRQDLRKDRRCWATIRPVTGPLSRRWRSRGEVESRPRRSKAFNPQADAARTEQRETAEQQRM